MESLVRAAGDTLVSREALVASINLVHATFLARFNEAANAGVKRSELRSATELNAEVFDLVIERLSQQGKIVLRGESVYPRGSDSIYSIDDQKKMSAIADIYREAGLASPSTLEVGSTLSLNEREMHRLITFLLREKILFRMGNDAVYFHQAAIGSLKLRLAGLKGETMDVARFKSLTGLSRKYAIPLLEFLDREHITRKQGDGRLVL